MCVNYFSIKLGKLPFPRHCINSAIEYVTFWVWLLSLTIMYLRFMSVIADNKGLFFSLCYRIDIPHNLSTHSPAEGLSRCFKLLAVVNKTAKIFAYQFFVYANFISQMINDAEHFLCLICHFYDFDEVSVEIVCPFLLDCFIIVELWEFFMLNTCPLSHMWHVGLSS